VHDRAYGQHYSSTLIAYKLQLDGGAVLPANLQSGLLYTKKQQEQEYRAQQIEGVGMSSDDVASENEVQDEELVEMSECVTHFIFSPLFSNACCRHLPDEFANCLHCAVEC
jgi:hypothetical protein